MYRYAGEASIAAQRAASWTENCYFAQICRAVDGLERADFAPSWAFARPPAERDPRLGCKPVSVAESGRFEQIESPRRCARWGAGGQAQMGEDSHDHRRRFDGGDDLQGAAAVWAMFDVNVEHPLE